MPSRADEETYGAVLRRERHARGLSQRQLADQVGVDFTYLSKVENGRLPAPSEATIAQIAKVLGADAETHLAHAKKVPLDVRSRYASYPIAATRLLRALHEKPLSTQTYEALIQQVERARSARTIAAPTPSAVRSATRIPRGVR